SRQLGVNEQGGSPKRVRKQLDTVRRKVKKSEPPGGRRMEEQFLFGDDQEKQARNREKERRSRIYGTPEFHFAYAQYIRSPEWRKLCKLVKERAGNRCERTEPGMFCPGRLEVHHLTYDRFKNEKLTDLELLCDRHHAMADSKRERDAQEAFEE